MSHIHEQLEATNRDIMTSVREQLKEHSKECAGEERVGLNGSL